MEETSSKSRLSGVVVGLILIIGAVIAVVTIRMAKPEEDLIVPIRPVKTFVVGQRPEIEIRNYPGKISADKQVTLAFQVNGPIIELPVKKGERVKRGDLLVRVDQRDYISALSSAKAKLNKTEKHLARIKKSVDSGAVSKTDLTNAEASYEMAMANYETHKKALEDTSIYAQFDGIIGDVLVDIYQNVQAKEPVLILQDITILEIEADVPESRVIISQPKNYEIEKVSSRYAAIFDHLPNMEFEVNFKEVATKADPLTQTYLVVFTMQAPDYATILPGMTVTLREYRSLITDKTDQTFIIPASSFMINSDGDYQVWKILKNIKDDNYTARKFTIRVEDMKKDLVVVTYGLEKNDRIALAGINFLQDGQQVRLYKSKEDKK